MAMKLPADIVKRLAELETDLRNTAAELRDEWDEKSDRWREGPAGEAADTWLETLENLADEIEAVTPKPED